MRKTAKMKELLEQANSMLTNHLLSQEAKKGVALFIEVMLHKANAYSGYNNYKPCINDSMISCSKGDEGYEEWTRIYYAPRGGF